MSTVGAVVIGRNEGIRLQRCLKSLVPQVAHLVYVDSGSQDDSVAFARSLGATVVELGTETPFTAARARNAGFEALMGLAELDFVQFIDGDCTVEPDWIMQGMAAITADPSLGLVTGWRREIHPDNSIYNALCDVEWHRPAGEIKACGGDMLLRAMAFDDAKGFDPTVIAAEDDEFCQRLAAANWKLLRIPKQMTIHDANMLHFSEWWKRAERSGHGFAQVADLHIGYFSAERKRVLVFGGILPLMALIGLLFSTALLFGVITAYGLSYGRTILGLKKQGVEERPLLYQLSGLLSLSKLPNMIGMIRYYWRKHMGRDMRLIEYK
ncbi:MAG: glycosyltransferase family A protein [Planktotalea sp.]|jgi:GT2 family glycosyltransferase|uniref:glycosyltransferase n=1 Tax=Planktotalea sp. TaxID=2029877 RepID=UPI0026109964|nr:glycosyltransferase family A protein [Planktotalea sp.]MDG1077580.1 glycosyltransferase family A protein [Planktotalea sp.]MDG1082901.1 glycosyltransferase family A protein [Planktotalea sp.]